MSEFADVVVIAAAESFRGDGEIFGSGILAKHLLHGIARNNVGEEKNDGQNKPERWQRK